MGKGLKGTPKFPPELIGAIADTFLPYIDQKERAGRLADLEELLLLFGESPGCVVRGLKESYELGRGASEDPHQALKPHR